MVADDYYKRVVRTSYGLHMTISAYFQVIRTSFKFHQLDLLMAFPTAMYFILSFFQSRPALIDEIPQTPPPNLFPSVVDLSTAVFQDEPFKKPKTGDLKPSFPF